MVKHCYAECRLRRVSQVYAEFRYAGCRSAILYSNNVDIRLLIMCLEI
jgi:hypothetical protein